MKLVNSTEFFAMPPGTLFQEYQPCWRRKLCVKCETYPHADPRLTSVFYVPLDMLDDVDAIPGDVALGNHEVGLDLETPMRLNDFDGTAQYAVWSRDDVVALIQRLSTALAIGGERGGAP